MKKLTMFLAALFLASAALASGDIVLGNGNATLTYTPGGGANMVISWAPPYTPPAAWTPTWAISMGLTNSDQFTDSGLYVQQGWQIRMLANVRSNVTGYKYMGIAMSGSTFDLGHHASGAFYFGYGNGGANVNPAFPGPGWMFVTLATTNFTAVLTTNGVVSINTVSTSSFATNTTTTFYVGEYHNGTASRCPNWDVARIQFIDPNGVLKRDLIATPYGYFTNVLDGVGYSYGVNGQGGTSLDSSNVIGQAFPAMNWVAPTTTGWSPEWAISMNVTSAVQYSDVGVLGGKGWTLKFLSNMRSNSASGRSMMGTTYNAVPYAGIGFGWTTAMAGWFWYSQALITPGTFYTGWSYTDCVPDADINYMNFTTNGVFIGKAGPWNASGANTINYRIGLRSGATTYCCCWDFVRAQFTDPNNVVQRDLFATPVGTFWDSVTKSFYTFGVNGVGGTSLDSTNIIKQTIPAQTWK